MDKSINYQSIYKDRLEISREFSKRYFHGHFDELIPSFVTTIPEENRAVILCSLENELASLVFARTLGLETNHFILITSIDGEIQYAKLMISEGASTEVASEIPKDATVREWMETMVSMPTPHLYTIANGNTILQHLP